MQILEAGDISFTLEGISNEEAWYLIAAVKKRIQNINAIISSSNYILVGGFLFSGGRTVQDEISRTSEEISRLKLKLENLMIIDTSYFVSTYNGPIEKLSQATDDYCAREYQARSKMTQRDLIRWNSYLEALKNQDENKLISDSEYFRDKLLQYRKVLELLTQKIPKNISTTKGELV